MLQKQSEKMYDRTSMTLQNREKYRETDTEIILLIVLQFTATVIEHKAYHYKRKYIFQK